MTDGNEFMNILCNRIYNHLAVTYVNSFPHTYCGCSMCLGVLSQCPPVSYPVFIPLNPGGIAEYHEGGFVCVTLSGLPCLWFQLVKQDGNYEMIRCDDPNLEGQALP